MPVLKPVPVIEETTEPDASIDAIDVGALSMAG